MKKLKLFASRITTVDTFLICFLVIFLAQLAYGLFTDHLLSPQSGSLDVVVRTFASAVFGYFLSGKFDTNAQPPLSVYAAANGTIQAPKEESAPKNTIGFSEGAAQGESGRVLRTAIAPNSAKFQTYVVAGVGLLSLLLIIILRNTMPITDTMIAPVTQLRDMSSSSIGYLIANKKN